MSRLLLHIVAATVLIFPLISEGQPLSSGGTSLPVGRWSVEFTNGVRQDCEMGEDGTAWVVEPQRACHGKAAVKGDAVAVVYNDDRVERWTRVAQTMIVEHWFPAAQYPSGTPVLGIARREAREGHERLTAWERDRVEEAGPATVKHFMGTLRQAFTNETAGELRKFIDPRYLKEHKLLEGAFPIQRVVTGNMYDLQQVAGEPQTILMVAGTEAAPKEIFLFRTTYYLGKLYLLPLTPPDPTTKAFTPWVLRTKVSST